MRNPFNLLTIAAMFLLLPSTGMAANRALLIGVGDYPAGQRLPGIDKDVDTMRQVVRDLGYSDAQVRVLRDADADLAGIRQTIETWLIDGTRPDDRALLYFSGHGSQVEDIDGDEADGADEVLLPYNVAIQGKNLVNVFSDDAFGRLLARIPAERVVVLIDACHSGTATKQLGRTSGVVEKFFYYPDMPVTNAVFAVEKGAGAAPDNFLAVSACQDNEKALATPAGSLFTQGLADAVAACKRAGRPVTATALKTLTAQYIQNHRPGSAPAHHPHLSGNLAMAEADLTIVAPPDADAPLWRQFQEMAGNAVYAVTLETNQSRFQIGENLEITCRVPRDGYLNIINLGEHDAQAVALFPNRFHPDNAVTADTPIHIPGPGDRFRLPARAPGGRTLLIAIQTQEPINAYKEGLGKLDALFRVVSEKSMRSFTVEESERPQDLGATVVEVIIDE
jgi:hypothetical protein